MISRYHIFTLIIVVVCLGCEKKTLFNIVNSSHSGIQFRNDILENDSINIVDLPNVYNGGGVGIGDFNNDGLADIYFTGNTVANKLYLNKGNFMFDDVSAISATEGDGKWCRGVSIVDINNDDWQDIYVCATILSDPTKRENILYINKGLNADGIPVFKNEAKEYGLADNSHSTQASFFDYDNDGDLDVYLAVNQIVSQDIPNRYRRILKNGEHPNNDKLFRNDWDSVKNHPVFVNVSAEAGILQEGYAHAAVVCDINQDGWKDIFVSNDYLSENLLYVNNGDGTFTNRCKEYFKHTAYNSMGADVVDINNDGLSDVIELDMNPEDNYRKKTMLGPGNYQIYNNNEFYGYQYQHVRNCLHINNGLNGNHVDAHPVFSDIGFYSGIAETDWSWAPLVADFDGDGFRDLIVTNGFPKDVTNLDFSAFRNSAFAMNDKEKLIAQIPEVKISNYAFRNNSNLKFTNVTKEWGMELPSFSNGAATADLDNDGDLDVVVNNINDEAFIYKNSLNEGEDFNHQFLSVKLEGSEKNKDGFGAWIKIFYDNGKQQVYETTPVRGYLSSINNITIFGLGKVTMIDSMIVIWPDNKMQRMGKINALQQLTVKYSDAKDIWSWQTESLNPLLKEVSESVGLTYTHNRKDFNDFSVQRLLPQKLSQNGPPMAVGDINKDGIDDLVIGGNDGKGPTIFFQDVQGYFRRVELPDIQHSSCFDAGLSLFDAENDGDLDLYVAVGGYEESPASSFYQDRLYINDGKGNFVSNIKDLPQKFISKSCVRTLDFDNDGDQDLFIGGRVVPWQYPKPASSILLRNDSKGTAISFTDVTNKAAPFLNEFGLVCDAVASDYDGDGWTDLVVAGEWMPIRVLKNNKGLFVDSTASSGIADKSGWWNCIVAMDIDNDGKTDFVAGNAGENSLFTNSTYPIKNYFNDFDKNGIFESITTKMIKDKMGKFREFTTHSRDELFDQLPFLKKRYLLYKDFAQTDFSELFTPKEVKGMIMHTANYFASSIIKNKGGGKFEMQPLPFQAQLSAVQNIAFVQIGSDIKPYILMVGNNYGSEVFNGRVDAGNGLLLRHDDKFRYISVPTSNSGVYLPGDFRSLVNLKSAQGGQLFIASQNNGSLKAFLTQIKQ